MSDLPTLDSERLVLRPVVPGDAGAMHHFFSDEQAMRWWSSGPHATLGETRAYLEANVLGECRLTWAITESGGEALGWVALIPSREGVTAIGYNLRRSCWGKGYGREAVARVVDHAFGEMGFRRIWADTDPDNAASNALLERLGFRREGHLREEWETHIGVRDSVIWGLLKREWAGGAPAKAGAQGS